jgi:hypothetical protein
LRGLLPDERHILDVLLSRPFEGRDELRAQAEVVSVAGPSCECGCPSVALVVDRVAPKAPVKGVAADGVGVDQDGNIVGVGLLVDDDGYMYDLDVWPFGGTVDGRDTEGAWGRPTAETFQLAEWEPHTDGMGGTLKNVPGHRPRDENQ